MEMHSCHVLLALALVTSTGTVFAQDGGRPLETDLTGAAEVPGPGDPDGFGTASLDLNQGQNRICYELTWSNLDQVISAHIHVGAADVAGPVVVTLLPTETCTIPSGPEGEVSCCTEADPELIKDIRQNPENYYINVHTTEFRPGAIRGQLSK